MRIVEGLNTIDLKFAFIRIKYDSNISIFPCAKGSKGRQANYKVNMYK